VQTAIWGAKAFGSRPAADLLLEILAAAAFGSDDFFFIVFAIGFLISSSLPAGNQGLCRGEYGAVLNFFVLMNLVL